MKRVLPALILATAAFVLDQATKWAMVELVMRPPRRIELTPFFNLVLGFNSGVSFGLFRDLLEGVPEVVSLLKLAIVAMLAAWLWRTPYRAERLGLALIIGGALGNVADRLRVGAVVDFLDFHLAGRHWPAFNLADTAISIGAALLLSAMLLPDQQRRPYKA